ncbi:hypothetical protein [Fusibacter sp. JL216-2]|uniref:hypothetical protein n=1 Tax=Fusibacter sp. JL216-2 TaxID=3071453 RepID=UPI003D32A36E
MKRVTTRSILLLLIIFTSAINIVHAEENTVLNTSHSITTKFLNVGTVPEIEIEGMTLTNYVPIKNEDLDTGWDSKHGLEVENGYFRLENDDSYNPYFDLNTLVPGETYTLLYKGYKNEGGRYAAIHVGFFDTSGSRITSYAARVSQSSPERSKVTFTVPTNTVKSRVYGIAADGVLFFKDLMVVKGDFNSITPSYFTGTKSTEGLAIRVTGKNLFSLKQYLLETSDKNIVDFSEESLKISGWVNSDYRIRLKANSKYVYSADIDNSDGQGKTRIRVDKYSTDGSFIEYGNANPVSAGAKETSKGTIQTGDEEVIVSIGLQIFGGYSGRTVFSNIQLEEGDEPSQYEAYRESYCMIDSQIKSNEKILINSGEIFLNDENETRIDVDYYGELPTMLNGINHLTIYGGIVPEGNDSYIASSFKDALNLFTANVTYTDDIAETLDSLLRLSSKNRSIIEAQEKENKLLRELLEDVLGHTAGSVEFNYDENGNLTNIRGD